MLPLCKDCLNCKQAANIYDPSHCMRTMKMVQSLVTGKMEYVKPLPTCLSERSSIFPWKCGKLGKHFVSRDSAKWDIPEELTTD